MIITAKVVLWLPAIEQESPDCLPARDIEVEFVNFGKSLPHLLGAVPRQSRITRLVEKSLQGALQEIEAFGALIFEAAQNFGVRLSEGRIDVNPKEQRAVPVAFQFQNAPRCVTDVLKLAKL